MLEYHSHLLPVYVYIHFFIRQIHIVEINFAAAWNLQKIQAAQQRAFPEPDGPIMDTTSFCRISSVTPFNTWSLPKSFFRFST